MEKTGRNAPCPCGSGKKYKKCCLEKDIQAPAPTPELQELREEVREMLEGKSFKTLKEANAYLQWQMGQQNRAPHPDFEGLSPEQMGRFLYEPFDSPQLVTFPQVLSSDPSAPIITLFRLLSEAIGVEGMKPTATGNLPRQFCRDAAPIFYGEETFAEISRYHSINMEPDFPELNVTRLVAELAGLVRKYKGKFILSRKCREVLAKDGMAGAYPLLFQAFIRDYNWGYGDRYPELPFIQQSFLFTLYLLRRYGNEMQPVEFYQDQYVKAFPTTMRELPDMAYMSGESMVRRCYSLRTFDRFAEFMGLVDIEREGPRYLPTRVRLRALPLLDEVALFKV